MPLPQPPIPLLGDICSVIFNNTLYTYSSQAFQALPLVPGANWTMLPMGEAVGQGVCVGSTPSNPQEAGFYVVGGIGTEADYQGLQKFTYSTGKWESLAPPQLPAVTQNRVLHSATYLNDSDTIFMYAGSQQGSSNPSAETFSIQASAPYSSQAYVSTAPPVVYPIILPWSTSTAVMIGGSASNTRVMLFNPATGWSDSGATLAQPLIKATNVEQAVLATGDDGSKNLYTFDMSVSPNAVQRFVLLNGNGAPVANSAPVTKRELEDSWEVEARAVAGRSLTVGNWPGYNSTLAPSVTRAVFAVAQDPNGLVVIAGGNPDDVLCMFDTRQNGWLNATAKLATQHVLVDGISTVATSTQTTATSTATSLSTSVPTSASTTATPTAAAAAGTGSGSSSTGDGSSTNVILGGVLGSLGCAAVLLLVLYFCVIRQRKRQAHAEAGHLRRASGVSSIEKTGVSYANDSFPSGLRGPGVFRGHQQQDSQSSFSSVAILMGRVNGKQGQGQARLSRVPSNNSKRDSGDSIFRAFKSTIGKPMPQPQPSEPMNVRPPRQLTPDDKGVSFAPNTAEPRPRPSAAAAAIDRQGSMRRSSGWNRYWSGGSALNILGFGNGKDGNQNSRRTTQESDGSNYSDHPHRITQDSATVPPLNVYEPRASFSQVSRGSPTVTQFKAGKHEGLSGQIERPVSAVSDMSAYSSGIPASVHEAWDPTSSSQPWGATRSNNMYSTPLAPSGPQTQSSRLPTGVSKQPQLAMASNSSDMSWLNLGEGSRV